MHQYISVLHTMFMQGWVYYDDEKKCLRYMINEIQLSISNMLSQGFSKDAQRILCHYHSPLYSS